MYCFRADAFGHRWLDHRMQLPQQSLSQHFPLRWARLDGPAAACWPEPECLLRPVDGFAHRGVGCWQYGVSHERVEARVLGRWHQQLYPALSRWPLDRAERVHEHELLRDFDGFRQRWLGSRAKD